MEIRETLDGLRNLNWKPSHRDSTTPVHLWLLNFFDATLREVICYFCWILYRVI